MNQVSSGASSERLPVILIRGFGGVGVADEKRLPYQGFNEGTVYPQRVGENYIYEGMVLRFIKDLGYTDATNIVGYYSADRDFASKRKIPEAVAHLKNFMKGRVVVDPDMAAGLVGLPEGERHRSLWIFRYYDLDDRDFNNYGTALRRLIDIILAATGAPRVNIIAHSMGGLIARYTIQMTLKKRAPKLINRIVTLGTPHRGVEFNRLPLGFLEAGEEFGMLRPGAQKDRRNPWRYGKFAESFPPERLLCVIGTNYRTYSVVASSALHRATSVFREGSWAYNRSDGLVTHTSAHVPGAPVAWVHKCHGGYDSLVTARESYAIARRFLFGTHRVRLMLDRAEIQKGKDWFGKSEYYIGVSVKPRKVDFELWHQGREAENCYGPFQDPKLRKLPRLDGERRELALPAEGNILATLFLDAGEALGRKAEEPEFDVVFRLSLYVGERDTYGVGFSDHEIVNRQMYLQAHMKGNQLVSLRLHPTASFNQETAKPLKRGRNGWPFEVDVPGAFHGQFRLAMETI